MSLKGTRQALAGLGLSRSALRRARDRLGWGLKRAGNQARWGSLKAFNRARWGLKRRWRALGHERRRLTVQARDAAMAALGRPTFDPFATNSADPQADARRERTMALPEAARTYALVFTPRSGSSRLEEILGCTRALSKPEEIFNPEFMPTIAQGWGARDLAEYVALAKRVRNHRGTFGFEATWKHVLKVFGSAGAFAAVTRPDAWVWLIREDLVLQAVSISRMVQTDVHHNTLRVGAEALARAEAAFAYDGPDIARRLQDLRRMEAGSERMFRRLGATPLRLSYERVIAVEPREVAERIAAHVGATLPPKVAFETGHRKLGTDKNLDFARRFRAENAALMARVDAARAPMLAALDPMGA